MCQSALTFVLCCTPRPPSGLLLSGAVRSKGALRTQYCEVVSGKAVGQKHLLGMLAEVWCHHCRVHWGGTEPDGIPDDGDVPPSGMGRTEEIPIGEGLRVCSDVGVGAY